MRFRLLDGDKHSVGEWLVTCQPSRSRSCIFVVWIGMRFLYLKSRRDKGQEGGVSQK